MEKEHLTDLDVAQAFVDGLSAEDRGKITDGHHAFSELYAHRNGLFIEVCRFVAHDEIRSGTDLVWRTPVVDGWFLAGITSQDVINGKQPFDDCEITYHLPESDWDEMDFAEILSERPGPYTGYTSADVLQRIKEL